MVDIGHRVLPAVLVLAGLAVMGTAIVDVVLANIAAIGPDPELADDSGLNERIHLACLPILSATVWTMLTRRRWWVPVALGAPVVLVALPTLIQEVPRNGFPVLGFLLATTLVTAGVVGNAMGPR